MNTVIFEEGQAHFTVENEQPKLHGGKCTKCHKYSFPKRSICQNCIHSTVEDIVFSGRGTIHASAIVRVAPFGFKAPYAVAYVDLEEGPRIFTQLTTIDEEAIQPETNVTLVAGVYRQNEKGEDVIGYQFSPGNGGGAR